MGGFNRHLDQNPRTTWRKSQ